MQESEEVYDGVDVDEHPVSSFWCFDLFFFFFFFLWLFFYVLFIYGYSFTFFMCETHCIPNQAFFDSLSSSVKHFFLPQRDGREKFFKSGNCQAFPWLLFY